MFGALLAYAMLVGLWVRRLCAALPLCRRNFALVADEAIALRPGLNVITGESGAGKSVLVTSLGQLLGAAAAEGCIRAPATSACVEGRLHLPPASLVRGVAAPCCTFSRCLMSRTHVSASHTPASSGRTLPYFINHPARTEMLERNSSMPHP